MEEQKMSVTSPIDQYENAKGLIDAIGAAVDSGTPFYL